MKKWIAAVLTLLLLLQALPLNAMAAAGHVLTDDELAAAYALTGFGDSAAQRNAVFHNGMKPNETWNAMQVSEWLDEVLNTSMYSVEDILSRASVKLAELRERDPQGYAYFTENPTYEGVAEQVQKMYGAAEEIRQELRYQRDRVKEQAGLIAELGRQLKEGGESMFASDRARLSAKIEAATAELKAARREVANNAGQWEAGIDMMQKLLDKEQHGAGGDDSPQAIVGDWISKLYTYGDDGVIENTASVNVVNASLSRMGRLSSNASVLSNDASSQIHVMTENEIGIQLYAGKYDDGKFIKDVKVTVVDLKNKEKSELEGYTDEKGRVFFETSKFVVDDEKTVHIKLDVAANQQGYRDFGVEHAIFKLGELRKEPLTPMDSRPYIYSASFKDHDILRSDFEMLYSDMNDMKFEIKVVVRTPDNRTAPMPLFCYWKNDEVIDDYTPHWVWPDTRSGNTYIFRNQWKRELKPFIAKSEKPFFAFSEDDSAERFVARIKSVKGVVDAPVDKGGKIFNEVLGKGFSIKVRIPVVNVDGSLDLPIKKMLPKIQIDPAGFVTISMGSEMLEEEMGKSRLNWKNQEMADLAKAQKEKEKKGFFSNYKSQFGVAYQYYSQNEMSFLMESKIKLGWFALLSGRWQTDNQVEDVKLKVVKLRGAFGLILKYSFSWQVRFTVGPVPVYIAFTLGISAGASIGIEAGFSWVNGAFHDWQLMPLKDCVINLGFSFTAQAGVGIKGYLDLWIRFVASLNFRLTLIMMGDGRSAISGSYGLIFSIGVTLFILTASKDLANKAGPLFSDVPIGNALPPMQQYAAGNAAAPEEIVPASQEPSSYDQLVPAAKVILSNEEDAVSAIRAGTSNGHTYAFYLDKARDGETGRTHQRVCWVDVNTGKKATAQDFMRNSFIARSRECDDYAFDVWSDGQSIFVIACCADRFDDDGYPAAGKLIAPHAFVWILPLQYDEGAGGLTTLEGNHFACEQNACNLDAALNPRGLCNPRIGWAKVTYDLGIHLSSVEVYGYADRVDDGSGEKGYACIEYTGGKNIAAFSDMAVRNALGEDHERVNLRSSVRGKGGDIEAVSRFRCFSFVALSRPREGVTGESAIELYDWEMNTAPVKFTTHTQPTIEFTLTDTKRQAVVVKKGDIGSFELVQAAEPGGDAYSQTLFYTEAEADGDGAKTYSLKGLRIDNKQGALTRSLSYDVTDYAYDVAMPVGDFKVQTVHGTQYIYWLSTVSKEKERESDPETWRLWVAVYDPATNTVSAPAVFSEFTLESGLVPHDLLLTTDGHGYLTVTPMPKEGDGKTPPMSLYSFPLTMKPVLTLKGMALEESTVSAGDFEDTTIALMNEGNMGISAFDLEMYTLEDGRANVVESLHCDCLHPENSSLTMRRDSRSATLRQGKQVIYRNDDFNYTTRQREWVLGEKRQTLKASQSSADAAWTGGVTERDSKARFVQSNMLMPGALASFTGTLKIPEGWSGDKTLYLRVAGVSTYANWQGAMANAAGVAGDTGVAANAAATRALTWTLDADGDSLVLQPGELASNAAFADAVRSGFIANAVDAGAPVPLDVACHDIEISHRIYADGDGSDLVDIVISNYADTDDSFRLTCAVYLDDGKEPVYVNLPYYEKALASRATHTITLPVAALVGDPEAYNSARVEISAVGRSESAYANNAFTVFLGGGGPLRFVRQPGDVTVQEGEDVSFSVEVGGGKAPYSYQWQVCAPGTGKWVDLKGFTGATISREALEKKWDGCRFRCVVTDADGAQITTGAFTLHVRDRVPTGDGSRLMLYLAVALAALALLALLRRRMKRT